MTHSPAAGARRSSFWPLVLATVSVAFLAAGGALLGERAAAPPAPREPRVPIGDARAGLHSPARFGLPVYPTSFDFRSHEVDLPGRRAGDGSVAFLAREGDHLTVERFYREKLEARGWKLLWSRKAVQKPGDRTLPGRRVRWTHPARKEQLTLLVVLDPHEKWRVQGVLSWSYLGEVPGAPQGEVSSPG